MKDTEIFCRPRGFLINIESQKSEVHWDQFWFITNQVFRLSRLRDLAIHLQQNQAHKHTLFY